MAFFLETLIGGLMAGMLYSLVALGFVLIFKASGVFNFAQGSMVLFAALTMVGFIELGLTAGGGGLSRADFLNPGAVLAQGTAAEIRANQDVIDAYLGSDHHLAEAAGAA